MNRVWSCAQIEAYSFDYELPFIRPWSACLNKAKAKEKNGEMPNLWLPNEPHNDRLNHRALQTPSSKDYTTMHALWSGFDLLSRHEREGKKAVGGMCSAQGNRSLLRGLVFIAPDRPFAKLGEECGSQTYRAEHAHVQEPVGVPKEKVQCQVSQI